MNKNSLHDLDGLLHNLSNLNPNLVHLSLLGNVACPHPLIQGTDSVNEAAYHRYDLQWFNYLILDLFLSSSYRYRVQVARQLPRLKFLDARTILEGERLESMRSGHIGLTNVVIKKVGRNFSSKKSVKMSPENYFNPLCLAYYGFILKCISLRWRKKRSYYGTEKVPTQVLWSCTKTKPAYQDLRTMSTASAVTSKEVA